MRPLRSLERPLPICDVRCIHAELVGVVFTRDLLVEQGLASARPGDAETRHPINRVDSQAEAVGLVSNSELQRRVDVALLLVAAHVNVVLMRPVVGETSCPFPAGSNPGKRVAPDGLAWSL